MMNRCNAGEKHENMHDNNIRLKAFVRENGADLEKRVGRIS